MKNWKTTISGVVAIGVLVFNNFVPGHEELINNVLALAIAWGFLVSRDHNK